MKYCRFVVSVLIWTLLSICQNPLSAQWESIGPDGGYVKCVERHNGILYAVTGDLWFSTSSLYVSDASSNNWLKVSDGSLPIDVRDIVVTDQCIIVGTGSGIFRSDDGGQHWVEKNNGFPIGDKWINHLAMSGTTLFAGGTSSGMLRSSDFGESWSVCNTGLSDTYVYSLTATDDAVFAGTGDQMMGVFRTTNNGNSWQQVNTGMAYYSGGIWHNGFYPQITCMTFSGNVIYAGTGENQGIWKSADNGSHWTHCGTGTMEYFQYTTLSGDGNSLFAGTLSQGLLKSPDGGQSWTPATTGLTINGEVNAVALNGAEVFVGTKGGIYRSSDTGASWGQYSVGLSVQKVTQPGFATLGDALFLATESGGIFKLNEVNNSWEDRTGQLPFSSWNLNALYANETALFVWDRVSIDGGNSWEMASDYSPGTSVYGYGGPRWMIHNAQWFAFSTGDNPSLYRSDNHGQSWGVLPAGIAAGSAFYGLHSTGEKLFLATSSGLYYSTNDGNTWQQSNFPDYNSWSLNGARFHKAGNVLYCGLYGYGGTIGIFVSTDNGLSWTKRRDFLVHRFISVGDAVACSGLNLEFVNGEWINVPRIMLSEDNGQNWTNISQAVVGISTLSLASAGGKLFVSSVSDNGNSIFCSVDKGVHWVNIGSGMPESAFTSDMFVFHNKLFAGTNGQSVWQRSIDDFAPPAQPENIAGPLQPCSFETVQYQVEAVSGVTYSWQIPSGWTLVSGNGTNAITVVAGTQPGLVLVIPSNGFGNGPAQFIQVAAIAPIPTPTISFVNDTLHSDAEAGNQWYLNGDAIEGATQAFFVPVEDGHYHVIVTQGDCSSEMSNMIVVIINGLSENDWNGQIRIYPNPARANITFQLNDGARQCVRVRLINNLGAVAFQKEICTDEAGRSSEIDISEFPAGMYIFEVTSVRNTKTKKLIINS